MSPLDEERAAGREVKAAERALFLAVGAWVNESPTAVIAVFIAKEREVERCWRVLEQAQAVLADKQRAPR